MSLGSTGLNDHQNSALGFQLAAALDNPKSNLKQIEQIKANAKSLLGKEVSKAETTELLNIIVLANEVIMNQGIENDTTPIEIKATYEKYLDASVKSVSGKVKTGQFSENIKKTTAEFSKFKAVESRKADSIVSGIVQASDLDQSKLVEADMLISDVEIYSILHLEQSAIPLEEKLSPVNELLAPYGAKTLRTGGGGACFYKAVSINDEILAKGNVPDDLADAEKRHLVLRRTTVDYMKSQGSVGRAAVHSNTSTWATDAEIRYLVGAQGKRDGSQNKPILVLKRDPDSGGLLGSIYSKSSDEDGRDAPDPTPDNLRVIVNIGNYHYEAVATTREGREQLIKDFNVVPVL